MEGFLGELGARKGVVAERFGMVAPHDGLALQRWDV